MTKKVFIENSNFLYDEMFKAMGWEKVSVLKDADLLQFTGGADVTPSLYGHGQHRETRNNPVRDKREMLLFRAALEMKKPMAGICRGGQFLNVMCGGKLWQHVDRHMTGGTHTVWDCHGQFYYQATSTHHQMIIPGKGGTILASAKVSTCRERCLKDGTVKVTIDPHPCDVEAMFYPSHRCLCFQPHPEFAGYEVLRSIYFDYIDKHLNLRERF